MNEKTYHVYALCLPTGEPFYIGKTIHPDIRFKEHLGDKKRVEKYAIIQRLHSQNEQPVMRILFETQDAYVAKVEEMRQITLYKATLTNKHDGEGVQAKDKIALGLMEPYKVPDDYLYPTHYCNSCSYQWLSRVNNPRACPRCKCRTVEANQKTLF